MNAENPVFNLIFSGLLLAECKTELTRQKVYFLFHARTVAEKLPAASRRLWDVGIWVSFYTDRNRNVGPKQSPLLLYVTHLRRMEISKMKMNVFKSLSPFNFKIKHTNKALKPQIHCVRKPD